MAIADWWIRLIRPEWYDLLSGGLVRRPVKLKKLRPKLAQHPVSTERLETLREIDLEVPPLDRRIVAAIVGVPTG